MAMLSKLKTGTLFALLWATGFASATDITELELKARIIAVGIPGIGSVREVGYFHPDSPINHLPEFNQFTRPGEVLDPKRLLVTSHVNYGAPLAISSQRGGTILSIDPFQTETLVIPPHFAIDGGQAATLNGHVRVFTAQHAAFSNRKNNPTTISAEQLSVANPKYISINNAFGRPWFANCPFGDSGPGTSTVIDATGRPLANPPSVVAGGVFTGSKTNRRPKQYVTGDLMTCAISTAFMGKSPDGSGFAVFAVVQSNGEITQVHVRDGVDGLLPANTLRIKTVVNRHNPLDMNATHVGMAFNWTPVKTLFITEPTTNSIAKVDLKQDAHLFHVDKLQRLRSRYFSFPIDVAPAIPEIANSGFTSHTTLAGGADMFVANRGNGSLLRMNQHGEVSAVAKIHVPGLGLINAGRINGIAISADAQKIRLTLNGSLPNYPKHPGILIEVPAFSATAQPQMYANNQQFYNEVNLPAEQVLRGKKSFMHSFTVSEGLGPRFNDRNCVSCHNVPSVGGAGIGEATTAIRVGILENLSGGFDDLTGRGGPQIRRHAISSDDENHIVGIPQQANVTSIRTAPPLYGLGLIDLIPDELILKGAVPKGDGIHGKPNLARGADGKMYVGKYGWKAHNPTLNIMVAEAFATELGITTPLMLQASTTRQAFNNADEQLVYDHPVDLIHDVSAFIRSLQIPTQVTQ